MQVGSTIKPFLRGTLSRLLVRLLMTLFSSPIWLSVCFNAATGRFRAIESPTDVQLQAVGYSIGQTVACQNVAKAVSCDYPTAYQCWA